MLLLHCGLCYIPPPHTRHTEKLPDDFALLLFLHASAIVQDQPKNKVYTKSEVIDLLQ